MAVQTGTSSCRSTPTWLLRPTITVLIWCFAGLFRLHMGSNAFGPPVGPPTSAASRPSARHQRNVAGAWYESCFLFCSLPMLPNLHAGLGNISTASIPRAVTRAPTVQDIRDGMQLLKSVQ
jgi:hypothetical protein